jgi:hypothetical protein
MPSYRKNILQVPVCERISPVRAESGAMRLALLFYLYCLQKI